MDPRNAHGSHPDPEPTALTIGLVLVLELRVFQFLTGCYLPEKLTNSDPQDQQILNVC